MKRLLVLLLLAPSLCAASEERPVVVRGECPAGANFEEAGYTIRSARLTSPFSFLRWIRADLVAAEKSVKTLEGRPFRYADVWQKRDEIEKLNFLPAATQQRVRISLVVVSVANCEGNALDVAYSDFSSQIAPVLSATVEAGQVEKSAPERAAGADDVAKRLRVAPLAGYDRSEHLYGGGRVDYRHGSAAAWFPFDNVSIAGRGSDSMHDLSASLGGAIGSVGEWLAHKEWQLTYLNSSAPTEDASLEQHRGAFQFTAITRDVGPGRLPLRFGGLIEGGRLDSDFRTHELPNDTVRGADYGAAKLYGGITTRMAMHTVSGSYGIELGSRFHSSAVDWVKHVVDLAHDAVIRVDDHRTLDLESRLTGGVLDVTGRVPVTSRFFGGTREHPFIAGDSWIIRSNPVLRSMPANRLAATTEGPGGTRFFAYNLTAALTVWRRPVVPLELSRDEEFTGRLATALETPTKVLEADYAAKDSQFKAATARLPDLQAALTRLKAAVTAAQSAHPGQFANLFRACTSAISFAERRAKAAAETREAVQYGNVASLLTVDETEDRLTRLRAACVVQLNGELRDEAIANAGSAVAAIHADMEQRVAAIDHAAAGRAAVAELTYVKQTLDTLINDMNLVAVAPVVMFDVAHLGPAASGREVHYGLGAGLRITLASHVDFTIGYVANLNRAAREPAGAFAFAIRFKDLLQ